MKNSLLLCCALLCTHVLAEDPVIESHQFTDFDLKLTHTGTPGTRYALELSTDLTGWTAVAESLTTAPGLFAAGALLEGTAERYFTRLNGTLPAPLLDWLHSHPISPGDGDDIPFDAPFRWMPLGAPGLTYEFELFPAVRDGEGGWSAGPEALLRITGLTVPAFDPPAGALHTGGNYIWRVTTRLGPRAIRGREVAVFGPGRHTAKFDFSTGAFVRNNTGGAATDWSQLLDGINELAERKAALQAELAANPLVQDRELYDELFTLLGLNDTVKAVLTALLTGDTSSLTDPDVVLQALEYLQDLANFASRPDKGKSQTPAQKALEAFAARLGTIRAALENAADRAAQLQETLDSVKDLVEEVTEAIGDPVNYLLEMVKEKLKEKVMAKLKRLVGEKAAGAMVGIAADLIALGQAIGTITELEDLCREQNRLILEAIACAPASRVAAGSGTVEVNRGEPFPPGCKARVRGVKYCFVPTPGGLPNAGHFVPSPVPFADGSLSKEFDIPAGGTRFVSPRVAFLPAAVNCQPGQGPCILYAEVVVTCPGVGPGDPMMLFAGVIRCP